MGQKFVRLGSVIKLLHHIEFEELGVTPGIVHSEIEKILKYDCDKCDNRGELYDRKICQACWEKAFKCESIEL